MAWSAALVLVWLAGVEPAVEAGAEPPQPVAPEPAPPVLPAPAPAAPELEAEPPVAEVPAASPFDGLTPQPLPPRVDPSDLFDPWAVPVQSVIPRSERAEPSGQATLLDPWQGAAASRGPARSTPDLRHPFDLPRSSGPAARVAKADLRDPFGVRPAPAPARTESTRSPDLRDPFRSRRPTPPLPPPIQESDDTPSPPPPVAAPG